MRVLIGLIVGMGVAILVALALVAYGIVRGVGGDEESVFGERDLGLPAGCEIAESRIGEGRLLLRTTGLADRGCQQVIVIDLASGRELGRFKAQATTP